MTTANYKPHIAALVAVFFLGNTAILTPSFSATNIMILSVLSFAFLWVGHFLKENKCKNKLMLLGINIAVCIAALYGAATVLSDYLMFLKAEQMKEMSLVLLAVGFGAVVLAFSVSKTHAIYKYCLFIFVIIGLMVLLCFASGIKNFDFKNLSDRFFDSGISFKNALRFCLPIVVIPFFAKYDNSKKALFYGALMGVFAILTVMLQSALTLGSADVTYPYLKAVSVISVGGLFTRIDGLVYVLFFATALIKSVVCIKVAISSLQGFKLLF